jgi:hypothetical protein
VPATATCEMPHVSCGFPQRSTARSLLERAGLAPEPSAQWRTCRKVRMPSEPRAFAERVIS